MVGAENRKESGRVADWPVFLPELKIHEHLEHLIMPATYDKMGIRFLYPENWTLDEEDAVQGCKSVSVNSPKGLVDRTASTQAWRVKGGVINTKKI